MSNDIVLVKLDHATIALAECKTAMEAKQIADVAEAARVYLERTKASVDTVNRATEIRLLAERQMGEFLKEMPRNRGNMVVFKGKDSSGSHIASQPEGDRVPTLSDMGIERVESSRAQELADIPKAEFTERIEEAKASGEKLTRSTITRTNRVRTVFTFDAWKRQARSVMTTWLQAVPEEQRDEAAKFLSDLPATITQKLK